jgi:hypothetical protein
MSRLKRPLNPAAVKKANDEFYANHPEMVGEDGKKIPLSPGDPAQASQRAEWFQLYLKNGGQEETKPASTKKPEAPVAPCPPKEEAKKKEKEKEKEKDKKKPIPTLKVRWSKPKVTPVHNSAWPPATAPTDTIPEEAKVRLIGETTNVPDGTPASMKIYHSGTGAAVKDGSFSSLKVQGGKVLDPATGKEPEWFFEAKHVLWDPWNKPYYYFNCKVDYEGLSESTPKDFKAQEAASLRLIYWHQCTAETSDLKGVLPECNTVAGILNGVAYSKAAVQNVTTVNIPLARYGSLVRNTYAFHQASHGNALNRATGAGIPEDDPGESKHDKSKWRSVVHITPMPRFGDAQIKNKASVPSVPRYLFYSSTCLTGWEPSFAKAMIARGTRNVLAFRCSIPDSEAPQMARKFYTRWAKTYKLNPEKIPECFFKAGADHYKNMKPILYGAGGGAISAGLSPLAIAGIVIGAVAIGALIGVAAWALLKK